MKKIILGSFLLIFLAMSVNSLGQRKVDDFNFDWKFNLGDAEEAYVPAFNDDNWQVLDLPHDWSVEQNYTTDETAGSTGFLPTGIGWYRKSFVIPESSRDRKIHIEFDGVFSNSRVWINGHFLGNRPYGYSVFGYDLTEYIDFGGENVIAVKADHSNFADSRWYTGSGIYRNVRLVTTSGIFVPQFGVWVETPEVNQKTGLVDVFTVIKNEESPGKFRLAVSIENEVGEVVAYTVKKVSIGAKDTVKTTLKVKNPKLWGIDNPYLYRANVEIFDGRELKDDFSVTFGIRSIAFDADKGFFLNNENIKLKGVCLHHDAGAVGGVFIRDVWKRRLKRLKDIGVNAIRMAHNPGDPGLLKLCDEMGFVVINEAFDEWKRNKDKWITSRFSKDMRPELNTGYGDIFDEWAERDVKDMVRYSRNHPSIIMWSMGNEIEWTYPYYFKMEKSNQGLGNQVFMEETEDGRDELKETSVQLQKWIKEIDDTRFVTAGGVLPKAGNITGYFDVPDVMGYNYRASQYDQDHKNYPNRIIYGSENWGTYQEWKDARDRDFVAGLFLWTGIAYMGESGPFPWKGLEISLLDFAGFYTPRGHFFKTLWNDEPSVYIGTKHYKKAQWVLRDGKWVDNRVRSWLDKWLFEDVEETWNYEKGDSVFVEVFANSPEVELFVNDRSFGVKSPEDFDDHIVKYMVPYTAGEIRAVGLKDGEKEAEYSIKTAKWVGDIVLKVDKTIMNANGYDVAHVTAFTNTSGGDLVPDKKMQIVFSVEGEGQNIGVDNGWERNVQPHKSDMIVTHNGKAMMLVQSTRTPGKIKIKARLGKLESNEIVIETK